MRKLLFAVLAVASVNAVAADKAVVDRYNKSCIACHASGAAGAPRFGNAADWAPRLAKGVDKLLQSTKNGLNAMPPKGLCMDCSDADFKALIQYMSTGK
jgi:cytochrome c5